MILSYAGLYVMTVSRSVFRLYNSCIKDSIGLVAFFKTQKD